MVFKKSIDKLSRKKSSPKQSNHSSNQNESPLDGDLQKNIESIKSSFGQSTDLVFREVRIGQDRSVQCSFIYIDGLTDSIKMNQLVESFVFRTEEIELASDSDQFLREFAQTGGEVKVCDQFSSLYDALLSGKAILLVDQLSRAYAISMEGWEKRAIQESQMEGVIRGPREGFTEQLRTNTSMIRRRIKNTDLRIKSLKLGKVTNTNIAIVYIEGIVNQSVLKELYFRLDKINIDAILESGYIEQLIREEKYTPYPTVYSTERPDIIAAGILEGRVAIIVDGTPFVLLVPALFSQFFNAAEDYYLPFYNSVLRLFRYASFWFVLLAPSLYVDLVTFHPELVPVNLLFNIGTQRAAVPFPAVIEIALIMLIFELLRETLLRIPKPLGFSIGIVGSLVIGQAGMTAEIVTAVALILLSVKAMANFVMPYPMDTVNRFLKYVFLIPSSAFGLLGTFACVMILIMHLCIIKSFGVPYMYPYAPSGLGDLKDSLFRFPLWRLHTRPKHISVQNSVREHTVSPAKRK